MTRTDPDLEARKRTRGGRERLLQAAADLLRINRVAGTSLQMIADRLGVSKAAIYHHFKSRDDIIEALMEPVVTETEDAMERIESLPPGERAHAARVFYAGFVVKHREIISAVFFDRPALRPELSKKVDQLVDRLAAALVHDGTRAEDARARMLIYGIAAFVAEPRQHACEDGDLRDLVFSLALGTNGPEEARTKPAI